MAGFLQRRQPGLVWLVPAVFVQWLCSQGPSAFLQQDLKDRHGASAIQLYTWTMGLRGILSFCATPGIGALTDRWGRKPILGMHVLLATLQAWPLAIMPDVGWSCDLALACMLLSGCMGSPFCCSFAYCSDLAPPGEANTVQALIARMLAWSFSIPFVVAPTCFRYAYQYLGKSTAWAVIAGMGVANCLYIWGLMPESRKSTEHLGAKTPTGGTGPPALSLNPFRYFRLLTSRSTESPETAPLLRLVASIIFFLYLAKMTLITIIVMFAEERFGWEAGDAALLMSMYGFFQFFAMAVVGMVGKAVDERKIAWVGLISALVGMVVFFFTLPGNGWMLFLGMAIASFSMISLGALSSYSSCLVRSSMHGEVQGIMTSMVCLTEIIGPPTFGSLMTHGLKQPDAPWWTINAPFALGILSVTVAMGLMSRLPHISEAMRLCGRTLDQSMLDPVQ